MKAHKRSRDTALIYIIFTQTKLSTE